MRDVSTGSRFSRELAKGVFLCFYRQWKTPPLCTKILIPNNGDTGATYPAAAQIHP
jgi:hypothetical protein